MFRQVLSNTKTFRKRYHIFWWTHRWIHVKFILRELTSICVAGYAIVFLFYIRAILKGPEAFEAFTAAMRSPFAIILHVLALGGLLFHSITWFNLAPKAMVIKLGDKNIPGVLIALANYAGWIIISLSLAWLFLQG
jgi:fumarate reductase subunit C